MSAVTGGVRPKIVLGPSGQQLRRGLFPPAHRHQAHTLGTHGIWKLVWMQVGGMAGESAFLTHSQVTPMPLVHGPHFE